MAKAKAKLVTGLFNSRVTAESAVREISKLGYTRDDVSVMMSDTTRTKEFGIEAGSKAAEGASVGGAVGGAVGAILAAVAAVGTSIALPGLGPGNRGADRCRAGGCRGRWSGWRADRSTCWHRNSREPR